MTPAVGFIGLGEQGAPMAQRIAAGGFPLAVWARRETTMDALRERGATVFKTPAALAKEVDLLCICVTGDEDVLEVLLNSGALSAMKAGSLIAIHSTVRPQICLNIGVEAAKQGVEVIDAPVSGSAPRALAGKLLLMAGGSDAALAKARPVFSTYADPIFHLGGPGSGMRAKLINNFLAAAHIGLARSAVDLGASVGIDSEVMRHVLMAGSAGSYALQNMPRVKPPRGAHVGRLLAKDCALAREFFATEKVREPILEEAAWAGVAALLGQRS